jgi:hypothetical protein
MNLKEAQGRLVRDAKYRQQYEKLGDKVAIAMHLVAIRKSLKLSKAVLAAELGIHPYQISKVEDLASRFDIQIMALLVDRFQNELRREGVVIDHWLSMWEEAKTNARRRAEESKWKEKPQGLNLSRDRGVAGGMIGGFGTGDRINVLEEANVNYWTNRFGVNRHRLVEAVKRVGNSAEAVRKELQKDPAAE